MKKMIFVLALIMIILIGSGAYAENAADMAAQPEVEKVEDVNTEILPDKEVAPTVENACRYSENLLSGKRVWASTVEEGNIPEYAVDDDAGTRWTAVDDSYPQSITADLGAQYRLNMLTIDWQEKHSRVYGYTVEVSEDGEEYILAADCTDNSRSGETVDDLQIKGRYIRINVLSCTDSKGYAGIFEMKADGWSSLYQLKTERM